MTYYIFSYQEQSQFSVFIVHFVHRFIWFENVNDIWAILPIYSSIYRIVVLSYRIQQLAKKWKNIAIWNCLISARGAIKLHSFGTNEARHVCQKGGIVLPLKHLSSNCIIFTLFYCLTIEQLLIHVLSEVRHTCWRGASKNTLQLSYIVKYLLLINNNNVIFGL